MRSGNPALGEKTFRNLAYADNAMTLNGTVHKTALLLALCLTTAVLVWHQFFTGGAENMSLVMGLTFGGAIGGFIMAMICIFVPKATPWTAPIYALLEGLFLGGISAVFENMYPGIVIQAVGLTFGTLFCLLLAYRSGMIKATENFKLGVVAATGAIFLIYLVGWILSFFSIGIPYIHGSGPIGIAFSAFVVVIAALNLVLDFDFIEEGVKRGAPKYMEWYGAFGLMVTLVWLYLEILRLLAKLRGRD